MAIKKYLKFILISDVSRFVKSLHDELEEDSLKNLFRKTRTNLVKKILNNLEPRILQNLNSRFIPRNRYENIEQILEDIKPDTLDTIRKALRHHDRDSIYMDINNKFEGF